MNKFFNWLLNQNGESLSNRKKKKFNQFKQFWDEIEKTSMPEAPEAEMEWFKLQRKIELAESKANVLQGSEWWKTIYNPKFNYAIGLALVLVLCCFVCFNYFYQKIYTTGTKQTLSFVLPDSTEIQLNCESQLKVKGGFNKNSRQVVLTGEAYFKVKKSEHPFIVSAECGKVQVIGTEFNVRSRDQQMEVAVNEGIVQVAGQSENADNVVTLTKGQLSEWNDGEAPSAAKPIHFKQYPGWIHGELTFHQKTLRYVCDDVERKFNIEIHIADKSAEQISITGLFETNNLKNLMDSISLLVQKEYRIEDEIYVIF